MFNSQRLPSGAARPSHELLIAGGAIVRDEFGLNAPAATGVALSVLYPLRRVAAGSSARPFLALSLELFSVSEYQMVAQEVVETTGVSWQPLSFLDLSLGLGGGIQTASNSAIFFARGTASVGLRLGAGIEQIL